MPSVAESLNISRKILVRIWQRKFVSFEVAQAMKVKEKYYYNQREIVVDILEECARFSMSP